MLRLRTLFYTCLCSTFVTSTIVAAASGPPIPNLKKPPAAWMGFGLMFVFFGIVISISLMSSKRGHQD